MRVEKASVCPLDCPDTCSLTVAVEDERIVEVRGSHANPLTAGVICAKVARDFPAFVHGDGRHGDEQGEGDDHAHVARKGLIARDRATVTQVMP